MPIKSASLPGKTSLRDIYYILKRKEGKEVEMGEKSAKVMCVIVILVVMLAPQASAGIYTCWGGCYNQCVIQIGHSQIPNLPCSWNCLKDCVPSLASVSGKYCCLGCSMDRCIQFSGGKSSLPL